MKSVITRCNRILSNETALRSCLFSTKTKAIVCTALGQPLVFDENWDIGSPKTNQVKIEVVASGINFADVLQIQGLYQEKMTTPFVSGMECAGYIREIGPDTKTNLKCGDPVICVTSTGGTFARHLISSTRQVIPLPDPLPTSVDLADAAALLVSYGTAHMALTARGRVSAGETVLVTAAAGGVGLAAVEIARNLGANVIVAAGSDEKVQLALSRAGSGATGFNYSGCDGKKFREKLKEVSGKGVDIFIDAVGGEFLEAGIRSLNWGGRAVVVGFAAGGEIPKIPANILLVKNVEVSGLYWGASAIHDPKLFRKSAEDVITMWVKGMIKPHVSHRIPLAETNKALDVIKSRKSTGKILLI